MQNPTIAPPGRKVSEAERERKIERKKPCCGGYTAVLKGLYSHVAKAIQP
jgi:hypothetical protein